MQETELTAAAKADVEAAIDAELDQLVEDAGNFESAAIAMLKRMARDRHHLYSTVDSVNGQQALMRQQVGAMYEALRQLWQGVQTHVVQSQEDDKSLRQLVVTELGKFQLDGPQRAMAGVFAKLFRDLIKHMDALDDLLTHARDEKAGLDPEWVESIRIMQKGLEATFSDWGCTATPVDVGKEHFDPEHHEAVEPQPGEVPDDAKHEVIVKVHRRGWQLRGQVLRHPQVVVA